jgi:fructose 1,6-bisphosphate aldolase/phosphatase
MATLSIIKADTGGFVGHSAVHPDMLAEASRAIHRAIQSELIIDGQVASCGDDISLIMTHGHGSAQHGRTCHRREDACGVRFRRL